MKRFLTAAMALSVLATAGAASAQPGRRDDHDRRPAMQQQRDDHRGPSDNWERHADRRYKVGAYHAPRGYRAPVVRRGERLAPAYRGQSYQVDYRRYNLSAPPRGYQYVRVNNDVVLTAIATGVITSVITQLFQ